MMQQKALLDTDIISYLTKRNLKVAAQARKYEAIHGWLTISMMTRYEVLSGLMAKSATGQLLRFEQFCSRHEVLDLTDEIVIRAARIYADLSNRGTLIGDADILIAATALEHGLVLVTNNERHFNRVVGLQVENWLSS